MLTLGSPSNLKSFRNLESFNFKRICIYFKFKGSLLDPPIFFQSSQIVNRYCSWNLLLKSIKLRSSASIQTLPNLVNGNFHSWRDVVCGLLDYCHFHCANYCRLFPSRGLNLKERDRLRSYTRRSSPTTRHAID